MAGKNIQLKTMRLKRTKQTGCMGVSDDSRLLKNIFQLLRAFVLPRKQNSLVCTHILKILLLSK